MPTSVIMCWERIESLYVPVYVRVYVRHTEAYLHLPLSDEVHVVSDVSLVEDDLGGQVEHVPHHQRQHPHELLRGIPE